MAAGRNTVRLVTFREKAHQPTEIPVSLPLGSIESPIEAGNAGIVQRGFRGDPKIVQDFQLRPPTPEKTGKVSLAWGVRLST